MGNALRPQRCGEDREAPIGGFAKDSIKPLSGFDNVLKGAILVIRRRTRYRVATIGTRYSLVHGARWAGDIPPEFWMQRTDMHSWRGLSAPRAR